MQSIANHLIRQNSPSSVAAFDDHHSDCTAEPQKQRPSSSSLRKMFQKMNGSSSSAKNQQQQQKQKQQRNAKVVDALSSAYSDAASASTASTMSSASASSSSSMYSDISAPLAPARAHDDECQRFFHDGDDESDEVDIQAGGPMEVDNDIITSASSSSLVAPAKSCLSTSESKSAEKAAKRSVHFDETVCIGRIPSLDTYTDNEINSLYYSAEEERILRTEAKAVVSALRMSRTTGQILDHDEYCSRGLENYLLPKEMKRRKRAEAKGVIHSVLMEQEDQYNNNYVDECALAIASLTRSRGARTDAMERAARDEAEIAAKEDFVERALTINAEVVKKADMAVSRRRSPPSGLISSLKASSRASCA